MVKTDIQKLHWNIVFLEARSREKCGTAYLWSAMAERPIATMFIAKDFSDERMENAPSCSKFCIRGRWTTNWKEMLDVTGSSKD